MPDPSDPAVPPPDKPPETKKPDDAPSRGDIAAFGIGCVVVIIFVIAIIAVGMTRE
jgi:hypothetical protein